jgi:hypothetical protein
VLHSIGTAVGAAVFHDGSRAIYNITKISDDGPTLHVRLTGTVDPHGEPGAYRPTGNEEIRRGWRTQFDRIELDPSFGYQVPIGTGITPSDEYGFRRVHDIYSVNPNGSYQARYIGTIIPEGEDENSWFRAHSGKLHRDEPSYEPVLSTPGDMLEIVALTSRVINREVVGYMVGHEDDEDGLISCDQLLAISPSGGRVTVRRLGYMTKDDGGFVREDHHPERADYTRAFTHIQLGARAERLLPKGLGISPMRPRPFPDVPGHRDVYEIFDIRDDGTFYVAYVGEITEDHGAFDPRKDGLGYPVPMFPVTADLFEILAIND